MLNERAERIRVCDFCKHPFEPFETFDPGNENEVQVAFGFILDEDDTPLRLMSSLEYKFCCFTVRNPLRTEHGKYVCMKCVVGDVKYCDSEDYNKDGRCW